MVVFTGACMRLMIELCVFFFFTSAAMDVSTLSLAHWGLMLNGHTVLLSLHMCSSTITSGLLHNCLFPTLYTLIPNATYFVISPLGTGVMLSLAIISVRVSNCL